MYLEKLMELILNYQLKMFYRVIYQEISIVLLKLKQQLELNYSGNQFPRGLKIILIREVTPSLTVIYGVIIRSLKSLLLHSIILLDPIDW